MSKSLWPHGLYSLWNSPGLIPLVINTRVGSLSLLQRIFLTQESNCIAGGFFNNWAIREAQCCPCKEKDVWCGWDSSKTHFKAFGYKQTELQAWWLSWLCFYLISMFISQTYCIHTLYMVLGIQWPVKQTWFLPSWSQMRNINDQQINTLLNVQLQMIHVMAYNNNYCERK